jgi:hypothetical protein
MDIERRRMISVEFATDALNRLARKYAIPWPKYEPRESDCMTEFDALDWTCLCAQRNALVEREEKQRG